MSDNKNPYSRLNKSYEPQGFPGPGFYRFFIVFDALLTVFNSMAHNTGYATLDAFLCVLMVWVNKKRFGRYW